MVYTALSDDASTLSQFTRKKAITITTDGTNVPSNFSVKLAITYEPEMQADFDDIRFNTKGRGYIDYWIESYTTSTSAIVWIELPDAIADPGLDTILMYFGNPGLSGGGNGDDTFLQYHGAASSGFLDSLVVPPTSYIYEVRARRTSSESTDNGWWGMGNNAAYLGDNVFIQSYTGADSVYLQCGNNGTRSNVNEAPGFTTDTWYRGKIVWSGSGSVHGYWDDDEVSTGVSTNIPNETMGLKFYPDAGSFEQDWSFARKYIANEPTLAYGTAQHQRKISQIM